MKSIIRRIFRYKITTIYFILGQLILYMTLFGALGILNAAQEKEKDYDESLYTYTLKTNITTLSEFHPLVFTKELTDTEQGNILITDKISFPISELGASNRTEIILKANEELSYKLLQGRLPGSLPDDSGKLLVALGREKYKKAFEENGKKYITICNEKYEVVGEIGSTKSDFFDYKVVLHINCIDESVMQELLKYKDLNIDIVSSKNTTKDTYNLLYTNVYEKYGNSTTMSGYQIKNQTNTIERDVLAKGNIKVNYIIYVFCLVNCIVISEFWIAQRRKELAIRKAFGMSNFDIFKLIFTDVLIMTIAALAVFLVLFSLYQLLFAQVLSLGIHINVYSALALAGTIFLVSIVTVMLPMSKVLKLKATQGTVL